MSNPTNKFIPLSGGYTFTDLTTTPVTLPASLFQGCKWFFSFTSPDGDTGSFELISGFDSATSKSIYTVADTCNITPTQDPVGTITIIVTGYSIEYKMTIDLDTGNAILNTVSGTATGDTRVKIIQVA